MSRKMRLVIVLVVLELALAGGWWYLAQFSRDNPGRVAQDFQSVVGEVMGGAMGAILGLGIIMFIVAARADAARR